MTINSTTRKTNPFTGNGSAHTFPFTFKVFTDADIVVKKLEASTSIETTLTLGLNNDYIVTLNADQNSNPGGSVTLKSGGNNQTLASGFSLVITSAVESLQGTDLTNQGGFFPEVINDALDKSIILHQQQQTELDRSIRFSLTNTIGSLEITENAAARANKVLGFDNLGEFNVVQELGTYRGNWTAGRAYVVRDLVKDTSTNNIFFCNTAHTSSGAQPLTTNTHSANWDLIVDAATAATSSTSAASSATAAASSATAAANSATAAASSQTAAASSATTASTKATQADTAKTAAETAKTAAETAKTAAETALDSFDDRYLGAKANNPTLDNDGNALIDGALYFNTTSNIMRVYDLGNTTWLDVNITGSNLTNVNTVAGAISNVNTVSGSITNVNTVGGAIANVNTVAGEINNNKLQTVANNINAVVTAANDLNETTSEIDTVAGSITNVDNVGNNIANVNTVAGAISNVNAVASNASNINTVGGAITNVNNVGGSIANVNTVANNLSGVNSFAERYRTDNSGNNPSTSLNAGDLFYNQASGKLLVYNGVTSAWEETQSVGNFFINTISSFSGTGGNSATFNGNAYKFTLSNAGQFAQQMLVSINGVVQKPNTGTGQPSEGFALDGANIVFSSPPPSNADFFIVTIGASVSIGTPSDNTVTSAKIVDGSIVNADINASAAIAKSKIENFVTANAANRLITGSNTANTLNAEGELTYGSSKLNITSLTQGLGLSLRNTGNEYTQIMFDAARSGAGSALGIITGKWNNNHEVAHIYLQSGDDTSNYDDGRISFLTQSASGSSGTRMRIEPDGKIGIGTTTPLSGCILHVKSSNAGDYRPLVVDGSATNGSGIAIINSGAQRIYIGSGGGNNLSGSSTTDGLIRSENNTVFAVGNSEKLRITAAGQLLIGTTSLSGISAGSDDIVIGSIGDNTTRGLTFATSSSAAIRWADAGDNAMGRIEYNNSTDVMTIHTSNATRLRLDSDGIKFGSDTAAANALNDYEEGLWTPTVNAGVDGGASYNIQRGWYTKIGKFVQVSFFLRLVNSSTGSTGNGNPFSIGGLPFTPAVLSPVYSSGGSVTYTNMSFSGSTQINIYIEGNQSALYFYRDRDAAASLSGSNANKEVYGVASYRVT